VPAEPTHPDDSTYAKNDHCQYAYGLHVVPFLCCMPVPEARGSVRGWDDVQARPQSMDVREVSAVHGHRGTRENSPRTRGHFSVSVWCFAVRSIFRNHAGRSIPGTSVIEKCPSCHPSTSVHGGRVSPPSMLGNSRSSFKCSSCSYAVRCCHTHQRPLRFRRRRARRACGRSSSTPHRCAPAACPPPRSPRL
jgi:hypothetical protein